MQLIGVQKNCKHAVKNTNGINSSGCENINSRSNSIYDQFYNNIPTKRWVISVRSCSADLQKRGLKDIIHQRSNKKPPFYSDYNHYHIWDTTGRNGEMLLIDPNKK